MKIIPFFFIIPLLLLNFFALFYRLNSATLSSSDEERTKELPASHLGKAIIYVQKESKKILALTCDALAIDEVKIIYSFQEPKGSFFNSASQEFFFASRKAKFLAQEEKLYLYDKARVYDEMMEVLAPQIHYHLKRNMGLAVRDKKILSRTVYYDEKKRKNLEIEGDRVYFGNIAKNIYYKGNLKGIVISQDRKSTIKFRAQKLFVHERKNRLKLKEQVSLETSKIKSESEEGIILFKNRFSVAERYYLLKRVKLIQTYEEEGRKGPLIRTAYAEFVKGVLEDERIELYGPPRVEQQKDVILGNSIFLYENSSVIEVYETTSEFSIQ